ncbi:cyclin family protein [Cryptosporidium ubiquitum]|uniref:Cyclin family protein n=1 Tax=Cryptosporidium ubiquitum TaxID=857276 RepID=A0A1J4MKZ5_9CRYT|nr:cyclin family protein [Cryptosporidium ubiquitum]OII74123.1 cyclin family protein [Cryptosporidium ubiquitum]
MLLGAMTRLIGSLTLFENNEKNFSENTSGDLDFKNNKISYPKSHLNSGKHNGTVIWNYWSKSSEASTRNNSNDELSLLINRTDLLESLTSKSSLYESGYSEKEKESANSFEKEIKLFNKSNVRQNFPNSISKKSGDYEKDKNKSYESNFSLQFNYRSYPLTNSQILNWMNNSWSEYEMVEEDIKKCIIMEIDQIKDKNEENKKVITPFHSLATPKISIGDYFITRIVKFVSLTPVDFCVMVILIRRAVKKSKGTLKVTTLTAHRLVLAAALLTYKLMYDVQYGIKFWAHIGGVPQWEMLMLEYHILKILNWDLSINYHEFKKTYFEILSSRDLGDKISNKTDINRNEKIESQNKVDHTQVNSDRSKRTRLQLNVSRLNSNRKK